MILFREGGVQARREQSRAPAQESINKREGNMVKYAQYSMG